MSPNQFANDPLITFQNAGLAVFEPVDSICLIAGKSYINPLMMLYPLDKQLFENVDNVIIDMLLSNGFAHNRFVHMKVVDGSIELSSAKSSPTIEKPLEDILMRFYNSHPNYVKNSNLTNGLVH